MSMSYVHSLIEGKIREEGEEREEEGCAGHSSENRMNIEMECIFIPLPSMEMMIHR